MLSGGQVGLEKGKWCLSPPSPRFGFGALQRRDILLAVGTNCCRQRAAQSLNCRLTLTTKNGPPPLPIWRALRESALIMIVSYSAGTVGIVDFGSIVKDADLPVSMMVINNTATGGFILFLDSVWRTVLRIEARPNANSKPTALSASGFCRDKKRRWQESRGNHQEPCSPKTDGKDGQGQRFHSGFLARSLVPDALAVAVAVSVAVLG